MNTSKKWEVGSTVLLTGNDQHGNDNTTFVLHEYHPNVSPLGVIAEVRGFSPEESIERARLIAAAPELLAALLPFISVGTKSRTLTVEEWRNMGHIRAAFEAVAKATGTTN